MSSATNYSNQIKDEKRYSRMKWSNQAEHTLRKELNDIALKKCHDAVQDFVTCSKENGLLVVLKCREHSARMNQCLHSHTNEEEFQKYRQSREIELAKQMESK